MAKYEAPGTGRTVCKIDMVLAILKFAMQSKEFFLCTLMEILRRNLGVLMFQRAGIAHIFPYLHSMPGTLEDKDR